MTTQLPLTLVQNGLLVGRHTVISFNRTLRVPEDGISYNLPAGFGRLPILRVEDVADRVPEKWKNEGGLIIPLYQREAMFLEFAGVHWRPTIAKVAVGGINVISGKSTDLHLKAGRQDYVVIPAQRWLDGVNSGDGILKQFVAMPLGQGYTVEAQVTDEETKGGFQFVVYDPKPGVFADPSITKWTKPIELLFARGERNFEMGIAAGGSINQQIVEDEYGVNTWDPFANACFRIHIVNSAIYKELTGMPNPPTPITIEAYRKAGVPWYKHYDETRRSAAVPAAFKRLLSVFQIDNARGLTTEKEVPNKIQPKHVISVKTESLHERINFLRSQASSSKNDGNLEGCLLNSKTCAELAERHKHELTTASNSSVDTFVAECYLLASESSALLDRHQEAEDFANRSLNSQFSESALVLRLQARINTGQHGGAWEDCTELLERNPSHEYAIWAQSLLAARD